MCWEAPVINLMNALAAQTVAAVHLFITHRQQSQRSLLIWRGGGGACKGAHLYSGCTRGRVHSSSCGSLPPSAHCGRRAVGAHVCCQLCPCAKQLVPLVPSFLTLGSELDNVGAAARLMEVRGRDALENFPWWCWAEVVIIQKKKKWMVKCQ